MMKKCLLNRTVTRRYSMLECDASVSSENWLSTDEASWSIRTHPDRLLVPVKFWDDTRTAIAPVLCTGASNYKSPYHRFTIPPHPPSTTRQRERSEIPASEFRRPNFRHPILDSGSRPETTSDKK
ncbi:hypothetical protein LZ554_007705 [Drepanopeziza brunnea f. sp. 'monogermtubi']|nr:hypothetical protein LZ554_007705 [Drepanopeziza brunnea f. sp. 'monogermtubi']